MEQTLRCHPKQRASKPQISLLRGNHSHLNPTETEKDSRITASAHLALIKVQSCAGSCRPCYTFKQGRSWVGEVLWRLVNQTAKQLLPYFNNGNKSLRFLAHTTCCLFFAQISKIFTLSVSLVHLLYVKVGKNTLIWSLPPSFFQARVFAWISVGCLKCFRRCLVILELCICVWSPYRRVCM